MTLRGRGNVLAPRDFGSAWFLALDARGEVVRHGPLDGGGADSRTYKAEDLTAPEEGKPLTGVFPLPVGLAPGKYRLLTGAVVAHPREGGWEELLLVAKPLLIEIPGPKQP